MGEQQPVVLLQDLSRPHSLVKIHHKVLNIVPILTALWTSAILVDLTDPLVDLL